MLGNTCKSVPGLLIAKPASALLLPKYCMRHSLESRESTSKKVHQKTASVYVLHVAALYGRVSPVQSSCPLTLLTSLTSCSPCSTAKALFNRAIFYVAVHGAAQTNMIFMPFGTFIYELRPRNYPNACYHHLAEVCNLTYYLTLGDGHKDSPLNVTMDEVTKVVQIIASRLRPRIDTARTAA